MSWSNLNYKGSGYKIANCKKAKSQKSEIKTKWWLLQNGESYKTADNNIDMTYSKTKWTFKNTHIEKHFKKLKNSKRKSSNFCNFIQKKSLF